MDKDWIIVCDPGKTSGLAIKNGPVLASQETQTMTCAYVERKLEEFTESIASSNGVVVCESYLITQQTIRKSRQNESLEILGTLRYLAWKYDTEFVLQNPSDALGFVSDDWLKNVGWYRPGLVHANDALRHLFLYMSSNGDYELIRKARG